MNQPQTEPSPTRPKHRASLVLHLWVEPGDELRISLEDTHSGQRNYFHQIEALSLYLNMVVRELQAVRAPRGIR